MRIIYIFKKVHIYYCIDHSKLSVSFSPRHIRLPPSTPRMTSWSESTNPDESPDPVVMVMVRVFIILYKKQFIMHASKFTDYSCFKIHSFYMRAISIIHMNIISIHKILRPDKLLNIQDIIIPGFSSDIKPQSTIFDSC